MITGPFYLPKLYMNAIAVELDPPGQVKLGQTCKILGKMGNTRVLVPIQFTRVEPETCLAHKSVPGGVFTIWDQTVTLTAMGLSTTVRAEFGYELALDYASKVADVQTWQRVAADNLLGYLPRVKGICELLSLPR